MRIASARRVDLATAALVVAGATLIGVALVAAIVLLAPPDRLNLAAADATPTLAETIGRTSALLSSDRVATVLNVDAASGAGGAARPGDHVDVLGYFSAQITGGGGVTRVLLRDVPVMAVDRAGESIALKLAVPQASALLLQAAQSLGARTFVLLLSTLSQPAADVPTSFSDADLANRLLSPHVGG